MGKVIRFKMHLRCATYDVATGGGGGVGPPPEDVDVVNGTKTKLLFRMLAAPKGLVRVSLVPGVTEATGIVGVNAATAVWSFEAFPAGGGMLVCPLVKVARLAVERDVTELEGSGSATVLGGGVVSDIVLILVLGVPVLDLGGNE
jgi:hypothetical protein